MVIFIYYYSIFYSSVFCLTQKMSFVKMFNSDYCISLTQLDLELTVNFIEIMDLVFTSQKV